MQTVFGRRAIGAAALTLMAGIPRGSARADTPLVPTVTVNAPATNTSDALSVINAGTGGVAGQFQLTNPVNSTRALYVLSMGIGDAFVSSHQGTAGRAGYFEITAAGNASPALRAQTAGTGAAGTFQVGAGSTSHALEGIGAAGVGLFGSSSSGYGIEGCSATSVGGYFHNTGPGANSPAVYALTNSSAAGALGVYSLVMGTGGSAGWFGTNNDPMHINASPNPAIYATTFSSAAGAYGVYSLVSGTAGSAGYFANTNTANNAPALNVTNSAAGPTVSVTNGGSDMNFARAAKFVAVNPANSSSAILGTTNGLGSGVNGDSALGIGVYGQTEAPASSTNSYFGGYFSSLNGVGISAIGPLGAGVFWGDVTIHGKAVLGGASQMGMPPIAIDAFAGVTTHAGIVDTGNVQVTGDVHVTGDIYLSGTIHKSGNAFRIDHPLALSTKYLQHSVVESPDMKDVYDDIVVTDDAGNATVTLPPYFEALNQSYRYQLTCIGTFAQAIISQEIQGNQFSIQTDKPRVKVSWQVTGIRHDDYANAHRIQVEVDKPAGEKGLYLDPVDHGLPASLGIGYAATQTAAPSMTIPGPPPGGYMPGESSPPPVPPTPLPPAPVPPALPAGTTTPTTSNARTTQSAHRPGPLGKTRPHARAGSRH